MELRAGARLHDLGCRNHFFKFIQSHPEIPGRSVPDLVTRATLDAWAARIRAFLTRTDRLPNSVSKMIRIFMGHSLKRFYDLELSEKS